jgi:hypothetical protein
LSRVEVEDADAEELAKFVLLLLLLLFEDDVLVRLGSSSLSSPPLLLSVGVGHLNCEKN